MGRTRTICKVEPLRKRWLSTEDAMRYLSCGENFLRKLRDNADIHSYRVGNKILHDVDSIDRYVLRNRVV